MGSFSPFDPAQPTILTVPGLGGSGPSHWQTLWESARPDTVRVELGMWNTPHRNAWVTKLDQAIRQAQAPVILAAHSLGCLAVAWWAERVDIHLERMWLDYWQGRVQDMVDLAGQCRPALEQHGSPRQRGRFFVMLTLSNLRRDRYVADDETLAHAEKAAATLRESDSLAEAPPVAFVLGFTRLWHGDLEGANDQLVLVERISERVGDVVNHARALTYLLVVARKRGRIEGRRPAWKKAYVTLRKGEPMVDYAEAI